MPVRTCDGPSILQSAAVATGTGTAVVTTGYRTAMFQVTGTFSGTITFQGTVDGTNWVTYALSDISSTTRARAATVTSPAILVADDMAGLAQVRANITAYVSGSITVTAILSS